jgi:elongation factor P--(R)-beta-lysine ligase
LDINWSLAQRRPALLARARVLQGLRQFFVARSYLDVETPQRIPAPAPESHIDAVPADGWFLHTSPELCLKRLLAAGYPRLFQISHCWRKDERGGRHLPEFTILEWYCTGQDYRYLMTECEELIRYLAPIVGEGTSLVYQGRTVDLTPPWPRLSVRDAFARYASIPMEEALQQDVFDEVMVREIEPHLSELQPVFLCDYPAERGALARLRADDPSVAERFELYIGGLELANAFSELTDALEQRERFVREEAYRRSLGRTPYPLATKFLDELAHMPAATGIALGVDRLVMLLLDKATIDDVVAFTPEEL